MPALSVQAGACGVVPNWGLLSKLRTRNMLDSVSSECSWSREGPTDLSLRRHRGVEERPGTQQKIHLHVGGPRH